MSGGGADADKRLWDECLIFSGPGAVRRVDGKQAAVPLLLTDTDGPIGWRLRECLDYVRGDVKPTSPEATDEAWQRSTLEAAKRMLVEETTGKTGEAFEAICAGIRDGSLSESHVRDAARVVRDTKKKGSGITMSNNSESFQALVDSVQKRDKCSRGRAFDTALALTESGADVSMLLDASGGDSDIWVSAKADVASAYRKLWPNVDPAVMKADVEKIWAGIRAMRATSEGASIAATGGGDDEAVLLTGDFGDAVSVYARIHGVSRNASYAGVLRLREERGSGR